MNAHIIVLYVIMALILLGLILLCIKLFNLSYKITALNTFLEGQVFSSKFHQVLNNYFSQQENMEIILEHLFPLLHAYQNDTPLLLDLANNEIEESIKPAVTSVPSNLDIHFPIIV